MSMGATKPVHPHVCGEHICGKTNIRTKIGSSPRMWGTCGEQHNNRHINRFIPTYVGNISSANPPLTPASVHPHVCGEHGYVSKRSTEIDGSSPRMWGTSAYLWRNCRICRFIPTYVGNISLHLSQNTSAAVHPHVCGEHAGQVG